MNAWTIETGNIQYQGDADARDLGLAVFGRRVDEPFTEIATEPFPSNMVWQDRSIFQWLRDSIFDE